VYGERKNGWIGNFKFNFDWLVRLYPIYAPIAQIYPLPLSVLLQFDAAFRSFRGTQSGLGGRIGCVSRISRGYGLNIDSPDAEQGDDNSADSEPQIGAIQRIFSGIIGITLLLLSAYFAYSRKTADAFLDGDIRGYIGRLLLFVFCFLCSAPFADTGFFGTDVWISLLRAGCK
jgi:hypothetical protein